MDAIPPVSVTDFLAFLRSPTDPTTLAREPRPLLAALQPPSPPTEAPSDTTSFTSSEFIINAIDLLSLDTATTPTTSNKMTPPEILVRIFELACECKDSQHRECRKTWTAASSVCRSWMEEAQRALFREIRLDSKTKLNAFVNGPVVGKFTTRGITLVDCTSFEALQFMIGGYSGFGRSGYFGAVCKLLSAVPVGLEKLSLCDVFGGGSGPKVITRELLCKSSSLSGLKSLTLKNVAIGIGEGSPAGTLPFRLKNLALEQVVDSDDRHNSSSIFQLFESQPLENLSLSYEKLDSGNEGLLSLIESVATTIKSLDINVGITLSQNLVPVFAQFTCLTELRIQCEPVQVVEIASRLPSLIQLLALKGVWDDYFNQIRYIDWPAYLLLMLERKSMTELKELQIDVPQKVFTEGVVEGAHRIKRVEAMGVVIKFEEEGESTVSE